MGIFNSKQKPNLSSSTQPSSPLTPAFTYQNMIKHITNRRFAQQYQILDMLGKGSYAQVKKAKSKRSGIIRAVKIIDRIKHKKLQPILMNQYDILKELDHPSILKIYEIYEQLNNYYIVMQLCQGKQLYDVLKNNKKFTQNEAYKIFYQLLSAIQYIHSRSIMHRDLKPQNIMYDQNSGIIKLIDFGSSLKYQKQQPQQYRRVGTTYYVAPEVIDRCYNNKCDVWSLGVVLYMMLSGQPPFKGKTDQDVLASVKKGAYDFKRKVWQDISPQVKMLITEMFTYNQANRPSINQIMKSEWIQKNTTKLNLIQTDPGVIKKALNNMQQFKKTKSNNIQSAILIFMVNFVKGFGDQAELQKCFQQLDLNGDGMLSLHQLTVGIQKYLRIQKKQAASISQAIFVRIDTNNSGFIDYSQFIVAVKSMEMASYQQNLSLAFDCMDTDKNGFLSAKQFQQKLGSNIQMQSYQQMLKQFKLNSEGEISKRTFIQMMLKFLKDN